MSRNLAMEAVFIDVNPNLSNFEPELRRQLRLINFSAIGKEVGTGISHGVSSELAELDLRSTVNSWLSTISSIEAFASKLAPVFTGLNKGAIAVGSIYTAAGTAVVGLGFLAHQFDTTRIAQERLQVAIENQLRAAHDLAAANDRLAQSNINTQRAKDEVTNAGLHLRQSNIDLERSEQALLEVMEKFEENSPEYVQARLDLDRATAVQEQAARRAAAAEEELTKSLGEGEIAMNERRMASAHDRVSLDLTEAATRDLEAAQSSLARTTCHSWRSSHRAVDGESFRIMSCINELQGASGKMWNETPMHTQKSWRQVHHIASHEARILSSSMESSGKSAIGGLAAGMRSQLSTLRAVAGEAAGLALKVVRARLKINSPSREFVKIGHSICGGLVQGLNDGASDIAKAACNIADIVTEAFEASTAASLDLNAAASSSISRGSFIGEELRFGSAATATSVVYENHFHVPTAGYHEILAAERTIQRRAARR